MWNKFHKKILKFCDFWGNRNFLSFICIFFLLLIIVRLPTLIIILITSTPVGNEINVGEKLILQDGLLSAIIYLCIITPFIETLLFQYLPIIILGKFTGNKYIQVLISTTLFGLSHFSSIANVIFAVFQGFIFAIGFVLYKEYKTTKISFLATALTHGLINALSILIIYLTA